MGAPYGVRGRCPAARRAPTAPPGVNTALTARLGARLMPLPVGVRRSLTVGSRRQSSTIVMTQ
eukprot:1276179-Pleurochrysis_carterae.AAC.1